MSSIEPILCRSCNKNVAVAKGLCRNCYNKKWKKDNHEKANATQKRYRDSHIEKCKDIERRSRIKKIEKYLMNGNKRILKGELW